MAPPDATEKNRNIGAQVGTTDIRNVDTTVHPVYNCSKKVLENLLPVGLFVSTNLFIPSRFWIPMRNLTVAVSAM